MCYVCSCFSSCLDIFQRLITFVLACFACWAISCGLLVAIIVGVAYGYNYSLAEFLSLSRSDVTVYMKRGQFYEEPDLEGRVQTSGSSRRSNDDDDKFSHPNLATDYRDESLGSGRRSGDDGETKPLEDIWAKSRDDNSYAEKLDKFAPATVDTNEMESKMLDKVAPAPAPVQTKVNPDKNSAEIETPALERRLNPKYKSDLHHERTLEVQPIKIKETIYAKDKDNREKAKIKYSDPHQHRNEIYLDTNIRQVPNRKRPVVNPTSLGRKPAQARVDTNRINQDPNIIYFDTENRQVPTRIPARKPTKMRSRNMGRKPAQAKADELDMSKIQELKSRFLQPDMVIRFEDSSLEPKRTHKDWDAVNKKNEDLDDERTTIKSSSKDPPPEDRDDSEADSEEIDGDEGVFYKSV